MNNPWQDISFLTPRLKALQQRCAAGDYSGAVTEDDKRQHIGVSRKFASAMIAKIPMPLSRHIARIYRSA